MDKQEYLNLVNTRCEYNKYNHIYTTDIGPEFSVVEVELRPESLNPLGMAHGGLVYSLCDVAAGVAVGQRARTFVTLSGSLNFLRPGKGKKLRCEGRIIKSGHTVNVVETSVYDCSGTLTARGTFEIYTLVSAE